MRDTSGGEAAFAPSLRELVVWILALALVSAGLAAADGIFEWGDPDAATTIERGEP